jgi:hypothetical protein
MTLTCARSLPLASAAFLIPFLSISTYAQPPDPAAEPRTLLCESRRGEDRRTCAADTSAGVALLRSTGSAACLLGNTWGYEADGVWVAEGCSGEFVLGESAAAAAPADAGAETIPPWAQSAETFTWGDLDPGNGFLIGRNNLGSLSLSAYALARYMNQDGNDSFVDHNGVEQPVDLRNDLYSHRILVWLKGWVGLEKLIYTITFWTVNTTDQDAIFANLGYQFSDKFNLYVGVFGNPGSRSMQGSHPYWLGHDRVMADEFFRAYFTQGVYANGELLPGLWYSASVGNNNSILGTTAGQLDRKLTTGGSLWWMPTTKEFGPKGGYGDWEGHEKPATRFGFSMSFSPEQRYTNADNGSSGNTTLRFVDSVNVFDTGALAPNVTVENVDFRILSFDAGLKYKGLFVQTEIYNRWLENFVADGPLPVTSVHDTGFYVQAAFYAVPKKLELYGITSQIFGDSSAGFGNASEFGGGLNFYPGQTRDHRFNLQVLSVDRSAVSSVFGYYVGGQSGTTVSAALSVFF